MAGTKDKLAETKAVTPEQVTTKLVDPNTGKVIEPASERGFDDHLLSKGIINQEQHDAGNKPCEGCGE